MDAPRPNIWLKHVEIDIEQGHLTATGGAEGQLPEDAIWLTVAGVPVGQPQVISQPAQLPGEELSAAVDWHIDLLLPDALPLEAPVYLTIEVEREGLVIAARRTILRPGAGLVGQTRRASIAFDRTAAALGATWRREFLRSRSFWRLWSSRQRKWRFFRDAIVAEMIANGEHHGENWIRLMTGDLVCINPDADAVIASRFLLDGHYEKGLTDWIVGTLRRGDTFVDVGSCYGHIAMAASRTVGPNGRVIAIEASRDSADRIEAALERNGIRNILLLRCAVSAAAGTASLAVNSINIGGNRLVPANTKNAEIAVRETLAGLSVVDLDDRSRGRPRPLSEQERQKLAIDIIETPTRTLDEIAAEVGGPVAIVKMDIEGAELLALRGATRLLAGEFGPPPIMTLEYSNLFPTLGGKRSDIFDLLVSAGMKPFRLTRGKSGGGSLLAVPTEADAPDHDDLIFLPPGRDPTALLQPRS